MVSSWESAEKGCWPVANWYRTTPHGEEIAGTARRLGPRLLGGDIADRAQHGARVGDRAGGGLRPRVVEEDVAGQAEVDQLGKAVVAHHDVLGLDIPMHDPGGMGRGQRPNHLADGVHKLRQGGTPGR
jgi:hypothetical protein